MNEPILTAEADEKKRCCEQSFLASVAGLQKDDPAQVGPIRRTIGLFMLAGVHLQLLAWSGIMAIFVPRYRRVIGFQWRYFKDVMAKEMAPKTEPPTAQ
jgi:hypothetical protein